MWWYLGEKIGPACVEGGLPAPGVFQRRAQVGPTFWEDVMSKTCFTCGAPVDEESLARYRAMEEEQKPVKIERAYTTAPSSVLSKLNELIDAVNKLI